MTNSWTTRFGILITLFFVYGIGYAGGRDQALQNHPICTLNLKP
jgi:hypothetical protein